MDDDGDIMDSGGLALPPIRGAAPSYHMDKSEGQQAQSRSRRGSGAGNSNSNSNSNSKTNSNSNSASGSRRSTPGGPESRPRKPVSMQRAKAWSPEVENAFRYQLAGFRDREEYLQIYEEPELWPEEGLVRCLRAKKTGFFMYFRRTRECEDKHLNRIILYQY